MTVIGLKSGQLTVEQAVVETLTTWMPTHVTLAARRYAAAGVFGLDTPSMEAMLAAYEFPFRPRGITVAKNFEDWPIDALPHLQVLSPQWERAGGDQTGDHFRYQVHVACIVGAQDHDDTRLLRACYEDAILGVMRQHQSLGGLAAGIDVISGGPTLLDEISEKDSRTFSGSLAIFEVLVMGVLDPFGGPAAPDPLPDDGDGVPPTPYPPAPTLDDEDHILVTVAPEALPEEAD